MKNTKSKDLIYFIKLLLKNKYFIITNFLIITTISAIIAFILPHWYLSTAIIAPAENHSFNFFSSILSAKGLTGLGKSFNIGGFQYSELDYYTTILNSRRTQLKMIDKFDLRKRYNKEYVFQTIDELLSNSSFATDPNSNTMSIGVYDTDPKIAKQMVEYYLRLLEDNITELKNEQQRQSFEIIKNRYNQNLQELKDAEDSLKIYQQTQGVIIPEEQFASTIKASAELEAQKIILETQLASIEETVGGFAPYSQQIKEKISVIENKINEFQQNEKFNLPFISLKKAPITLTAYYRLYRKLQIQNSLLEVLYPLYEQTKMETFSKYEPIVIIDKPDLPEYKAKPKRGLIIIGGALLSLIFAVGFIMTKDYLNSLNLK